MCDCSCLTSHLTWRISAKIFVSKNTYKEHFSWVDQVSEVRDPSKIQRLDQELIAKITAGNFDRLWLAIPDRVEWEGVAGFKYQDSHKSAGSL